MYLEYAESMLAVNYDNQRKRLAFKYNDDVFKEDLSGLDINTPYSIKIRQEREINGDYKLIVEKNGIILDMLTLMTFMSTKIKFKNDIKTTGTFL